MVALAVAHELVDRSEIQDIEALSFDEAPVLVPSFQQVAPVQLDCVAKTICSCLRELSAGTAARDRDCLLEADSVHRHRATRLQADLILVDVQES